MTQSSDVFVRFRKYKYTLPTFVDPLSESNFKNKGFINQHLANFCRFIIRLKKIKGLSSTKDNRYGIAKIKRFQCYTMKHCNLLIVD